MNILTTEQLIELIDAGAINASDIMGTKGIMNVSDWSHASPVTLGQLIKSLLGKIPETYWLVSVPDPGEHMEKHVHFDSDAYEDIEAECREPQVMNLSETAATVALEAEPAAVDADEGPELVAATLPERFKPVEVVIEKEPQEAETTKARTKKPRSDADFSPASGLGEWAKYKERALSTNEQNEVIKGMLDDGYSVATISTVIRTAQATVYNRIKKLGIVLTNGGAR